MPIRRPRGPKPALRHVAFLEAMDRLPETDAARKPLEAAFLTLRVVDQWMWLGVEVANPTSQVLSAARAAIQTAQKVDVEVTAALSSILESVVLLQEPDAQPVLPRVFALGGLYEQRGALALAADIYAVVVRFVDSRAHFDLAYDAHMRHAVCQRVEGVLDQAQRSYEAAGALAARARDRGRVLHSRIGEAKVTAAKGDLKDAGAQMATIVQELQSMGNKQLLAGALHDSAAIARYRNDNASAVRFAFDALKQIEGETERERVLFDLAILLSLTGAFETAKAALTLIESHGRTQEIRWLATMNLMDVGTRQGSETVFEQYRRALENTRLPARHEVGYLRDVGKGYATFGRFPNATAAFERALQTAKQAGLHHLEFEIEALLKDVERVQAESLRARVAPVAAPDDIKAAIDSLISESTAAAR